MLWIKVILMNQATTLNYLFLNIVYETVLFFKWNNISFITVLKYFMTNSIMCNRVRFSYSEIIIKYCLVLFLDMNREIKYLQ